MQVDAALRHLQLGRAFVGPEHGQQRAGVHPRDGRYELGFVARAGVRPQPVAGDERTVERRLGPVGRAGGRKADGAGKIRDAAHARGRVLRQRGRGGGGQREAESDRPGECTCGHDRW
ncbi:hypothetical protein [Massilia phosphatilytica]